MSKILLFALLTATIALSQSDGDAHGDAPFLIEPGWKAMLTGKDVSGWHGQEPDKKNDWLATTGVKFERLLGPTRLGFNSTPGDRILNGPTGRTVNLVSEEKFGDVELYLEFMVSKGSNSGVYMQGLYEVQIFDSWGSTDKMKTSDGGGIYHRWINEQGYDGSAPAVNASRKPGEWQSYHIWFRAPRFNADGKKTENAKFLRVLHNGVAVQDNVECVGPTRAQMLIPEAAMNPIMLQGDHGPVAFRNIYVRPLRPIINR